MYAHQNILMARNQMHRHNMTIAQKAVALAAVLITVPAFAQYGAPPPAYPPGELERLVSRIALYPDPLLAQILAAATYADQIPMLPPGIGGGSIARRMSTPTKFSAITPHESRNGMKSGSVLGRSVSGSVPAVIERM